MGDIFSKPIEELSESQLKELSDLMESYQGSDAWSFIKSILDREMLSAAMEIAKPGQVSPDTLHFQRGAMWAAQRFVSLPLRIKNQLDNAIFMKQASKPRQGREGV